MFFSSRSHRASSAVCIAIFVSLLSAASFDQVKLCSAGCHLQQIGLFWWPLLSASLMFAQHLTRPVGLVLSQCCWRAYRTTVTSLPSRACGLLLVVWLGLLWNRDPDDHSRPFFTEVSSWDKHSCCSEHKWWVWVALMWQACYLWL